MSSVLGLGQLGALVLGSVEDEFEVDQQQRCVSATMQPIRSVTVQRSECMAEFWSDIDRLPCNCAFAVKLIDETEEESADIDATWSIKNAAGEELATGSVVSAGDGEYTFTVTKAQAETMQEGKWYTLVIEDDTLGVGFTRRLPAVHHGENYAT